ncbi:hypothetical protein G3M54_01350 [Bacillus megaterium NBRC 15308 = ATCC 14581]|nr:hypothetical protein [Priestia megaterium NBRC 15308 = ATCC 14581]
MESTLQRELGKIEYVKGDKVGVKKLDSGDYQDTFPEQIFEQELHNIDILLETEFEETAQRVAKAIANAETNPHEQDRSL